MRPVRKMLVTYKFPFRTQKRLTFSVFVVTAFFFLSFSKQEFQFMLSMQTNISRLLTSPKHFALTVKPFTSGLRKKHERCSNCLYDYANLWESPETEVQWLISSTKACEDTSSKRKVLFLITSFADHTMQRSVQRKSWASADNIASFNATHFSIAYILGATNKYEKNKVSSEADQYRDIIQANFMDTYKNLTLKVQLGLHWATKQCQSFDYIVKTDDDVYINLDALDAYLAQQNPKQPMYGGKCLMTAGPHRNRQSRWYMSPADFPRTKYDPFCVGAMYFMSMNVTQRVVTSFLKVPPLHLEDVYIGSCMKNISMTPNKNVSPQVTNFVDWKRPTNIKDPRTHIAIHFSSNFQNMTTYHKHISEMIETNQRPSSIPLVKMDRRM